MFNLLSICNSIQFQCYISLILINVQSSNYLPSIYFHRTLNFLPASYWYSFSGLKYLEKSECNRYIPSYITIRLLDQYVPFQHTLIIFHLHTKTLTVILRKLNRNYLFRSVLHCKGSKPVSRRGPGGKTSWSTFTLVNYCYSIGLINDFAKVHLILWDSLLQYHQQTPNYRLLFVIPFNWNTLNIGRMLHCHLHFWESMRHIFSHTDDGIAILMWNVWARMYEVERNKTTSHILVNSNFDIHYDNIYILKFLIPFCSTIIWRIRILLM